MRRLASLLALLATVIFVVKRRKGSVPVTTYSPPIVVEPKPPMAIRPDLEQNLPIQPTDVVIEAVEPILPTESEASPVEPSVKITKKPRKPRIAKPIDYSQKATNTTDNPTTLG